MPILKVCAVRDRALDAYMRPLFTPTVGAAVRAFQDEVKRPESEMAKHPEDYDLYLLGDFDEDTGALLRLEAPKMIAVGKEV